jgi:lysozyme family protein
MQQPFAQLTAEYANLLARMKITRLPEATAIAGRLLTNVSQGKYAEISAKLGIPQIFIATSFERESSSNFMLSPAQGDPWNERSVHVPAGRGPYPNWAAAAIDTYTHEGLVGLTWDWTRLCYEGEMFNGFGYRAYGLQTPYDWSGTNNYVRGKFVSDGKFNGSVVDAQLGIIPVARVMANANKALDLPGWPSQAPVPPPYPQQVPVGIGGGPNATVWIQTSLNKLLKLDPSLAVDNNYGRDTKLAVMAFQRQHGLVVDGLAGPLTNAAIEKELGNAIS